MTVKLLFRSFLFLMVGVFFLISGPSDALAQHFDPSDNPSIENNAYLFADIDTTNERVYVLVEDQMWRYELTTDTWKFLSVIDELADIDEELEFGYDEFNKRLLFWSGGIGKVYAYDLTNHEFTRIDASFSHKNQFEHIPFFRKGTLHAFGGYGFWDWHNLITTFNPALKEWNLIKVDPESPMPRERVAYTGMYKANTNELYVFGGISSKDLLQDDENMKRMILNDFWKFNFNTFRWQAMDGETNLENYAFLDPASYRSIKAINTISSSAYSSASDFWYIPMYLKNAKRKRIFLQPVSTAPFEVFEPIEIDQGLNNERWLSNFMYSPKSASLIIITASRMTNSDTFPVHVMKLPEERLLASIEPQDGSIVPLKAVITGGLILLLAIFALILVKARDEDTKPEESLESVDEPYHYPWLSDLEKEMIRILKEMGKEIESAEIEERVWPDINNFDYRRKLRNDTFNSINKKFKEHTGTEEDIIVRHKDPSDNRRYRYGLNHNLLNDQ